MTALTRLIDAYNEYKARGNTPQDSMILAMDDAEINGDNFWNIARNCFPTLKVG